MTVRANLQSDCFSSDRRVIARAGASQVVQTRPGKQHPEGDELRQFFHVTSLRTAFAAFYGLRDKAQHNQTHISTLPFRSILHEREAPSLYTIQSRLAGGDNAKTDVTKTQPIDIEKACRCLLRCARYRRSWIACQGIS